MRTLLVRVDASFGVGYGHITRCINIANHLRSKSIRSLFLVKHTDENVNRLLDQSDIAYGKINLEEELIEIAAIEKANVVLADVNNPVTFPDKGIYESYLMSLQANGCKVITLEEFIDRPYPADMVIMPYVGAETLELTPSDKTQYLVGPKFFMFRDEFIASPKAEIRDTISNILVCMGGSDPEHLTEKFAGYMIHSGLTPTLKLVFASIDETRKQRLEQQLSAYKGSYEIIISPKEISKVMTSCDMGIVNSGLIKYETCMLGLPCITISNHAFHEGIMKLFAQTDSILHLGLASEVSEQTFNNALRSLATDKQQRVTLATNGMKLFDGKGLERICDHINQLMN